MRRPAKPPPPDDPGNPRAARQQDLVLLARRDYCVPELRAKLQSSGYSEVAVAEALEGLERERLVNDDRYVANYVSWHAERGQGPIRIRQDLRQLGLPAAAIEAAIDPRSQTWADRARRLREKRFGAAQPVDAKARQKQVRFLLYRGYTSDQIRLALGRDVDLDADLEMDTDSSGNDDA